MPLLLEIAQLPRATFYYHLKRMQKADKYAQEKTEIAAIYHENKGRYGYRRITMVLRSRGFLLNHKTVQRLMRELGLVCRVRIKKYRSYKGDVGKIAPNLLNRDFHAEKPNLKWVTDVTEFSLFGQKLYLSPILDLHNGYLITYTISERPVLKMVTSMLNKAFEVWYPTLEEELNKIKGIQDETEVTDSPKDLSPAYSEILEEILDLSRNNQKLLRTTDPKLYESLEQLKLLAQEQIERTERNSELELKRTARRFQPMFLEELIHVSNRGRKNPFGFLIILSQLKRDFPWIYDSGKELLAILKSRSNKDTKVEAIENFQEMIDFTFQHPLMRDMLGKKDYWGYMKDFPYVLRKYVDELGLVFL